MDADNLRELRDSYESALDEAEAKRAEFHEGVRRLHASGMTMRDIADALGISHQRVHQIVSGAKPRARGRRAAAGGAAILVVLAAGLAFLYGNVSSPDRAVRAFSEPAADRLLRGFNRVEYGEFAHDFDERMRGGLTQDVFARSTPVFQGALGRYDSRRLTSVEPAGGYVMVVYDARFTKDPFVTVRIVFERDRPHRIAGLWMDARSLRECAPCQAVAMPLLLRSMAAR